MTIPRTTGRTPQLVTHLPDIDYTAYPTRDLREIGEAFAALADLLDQPDAASTAEALAAQSRAVEQVLQARDVTGHHGPVRREVVAVLVERGHRQDLAEEAALACWKRFAWPVDGPAPYFGDVGDSLFVVVDLAEKTPICGHSWVAGMMHVAVEDLDTVASTRSVLCEKCDAVYQAPVNHSAATIEAL
jgi:hypothetical protein